MIKQRLATLALVLVFGVSFAQQDAQYSHYMFNNLTVNPGYAGIRKAFCATAIYRQQWLKFPGMPKTGLLSLDAYVQPLLGGVGLTITSDKLGFEKNLLARLAYAYHQPLQGGAATLGIGIEGGMIQKSLDGTWITPEISNPAGTDDAIPANGIKSTTYDLGFGLYYWSSKLHIGLSAAHLPEQTLKKKDTNLNFDFVMKRHYYLFAEYIQPLSNGEWQLKPSLLVKNDGTSTILDANLIVLWNSMIWGGASFRVQDAFVFLVGLQQTVDSKNGGILKIGYAFDLTRTNIKNYSNNTHEIFVNYCFNLFKPPVPQSHQTVRFL